MGANESYEVSNKIFTLPNLISFIRLLMIPIFLVLLFHDLNLAATLLFGDRGHRPTGSMVRSRAARTKSLVWVSCSIPRSIVCS